MSPDTSREIRDVFAAEAGSHLIAMSRAVQNDDMPAVVTSAGMLRDAAQAMSMDLLVELMTALIDTAENDGDREQIRQGVEALHETVPRIVEEQQRMSATLARLEPAATAAPANAPEPIIGDSIPDPLRSGPAAMLRAIVADDSPTLRQINADSLVSAGYEVRTARDGGAALRQLESGPADLVVTDFDMAPMNGPALIRALAADPRYAHTPVILVSGRNPSDVRDLLGDLEVAQIIGKSDMQATTLVEAANAACAGAPRETAGTTAGRILVAEDSAILRTVVRDQLVAAGYEVIEAADGEEAVELAVSGAPDVALLDREMPKLDGFGALAALKENPETADIPVVFVTGRVTADELAEGLDRGAHDYVRKPVQPAELLARIRTALRLRSLYAELAMRNDELEAMSQTDVLTGLTNRRHGTHLITAAIQLATRHSRELSVVMLDIDHFKNVNDTYGHAGGDEILRAVSEVIRRTLRTEDTPARWGGEEFLMILPDIAAQGGEATAERLRGAIAAEPIVFEGTVVPVTASLGVAEWDGTEGPDDLIARADEALYEAKENGRNRVCLATAA